MQDFDHNFFGVLVLDPRGGRGPPLPHSPRPNPCFLTPNIVAAPPPVAQFNSFWLRMFATTQIYRCRSLLFSFCGKISLLSMQAALEDLFE